MAARCIECGGAMRSRLETVPFDRPLGLPWVRLRTFVTRCPRCGAYEVSVPNLEGLHQAIARVLVAKTTRLTAPEIRFVRKVLGWSWADFAEHMGTLPKTRAKSVRLLAQADPRHQWRVTSAAQPSSRVV